MDSSEAYIITKNQAQMILKDAAPKDMNILDELESTMNSWCYTSDTDLQAIREDIKRMTKHVTEKYFSNNSDCKKIYNALHCIVFDSLHEQLMPLIKIKFKNEDMNFCEKCRYIRSLKINPSTPSTEGYEVLPYTSAVVELSMLDVHLSPLEKLNCLCTTYDLIFAELKSSLISLASKYSDKEIVVPVVNHEEVLSILVFVLTRSKLLYFFSNLYFIRHFAQDFWEDNSHLSAILESYETASKRVIKLDDEELRRRHQCLTCDLHATDLIKMLNVDIEGQNVPTNIQDEYKNRYISLITLCTDKSYIPTNI